MRRVVFVAVVAIVAMVVASCGMIGRSGSTTTAASAAARGTTHDQTLTTPDGRERTYRLFIPNDLSLSAPLLLALHGGVGSGIQFEQNSGFDDLAVANKFVVAYPDGIGALGSDIAKTWNGGSNYCCGYAAKNNVDDVGFMSALIDAVEQQVSIDRKAVFAAGHSNGGILAYRLACELSEKIVAVGVQSGSLGIEPCVPKLPVSLIHIHGTADRNHPIDGGVGDRGVSGVAFHPALASAATVAKADHCPASKSSIDALNPDLHLTIWSPCDLDSAVEFVAVQGASHAWMGHPTQHPALVGDAYLKYDSSVAIWDFLSAHRRP